MAGKLETRVEPVQFLKDRREFEKRLERFLNYYYCSGWEFKAIIPNELAGSDRLWVVFCRKVKGE